MIEVQPYNESLANEWDRFLEEKARNATFLHTRKFFLHNPINQEQDASLIFTKKTNIVGVVPAVYQKTDEKTIWNSHAFCTYGGFVVSEKVGVEDALEIIGKTIQFAKANNVSEMIVRNPFRIFHKIPTDEIDYALWFNGFQILRRDIELALQLTKYSGKTIAESYDGQTRKAVRKAEKENVSVKISQDFEEFWKILDANLKEKHDTKPTHSIDEFERLYELIGGDKIKLFGAYFNDQLIAGIIVFVANEKAVHAQYIAGASDFQHLRPVNLLIHRIAVWALENNFEFFNLGMSNDPDGSVNVGLSRFKEGFGARSVLRETVRLTLN